MEAGLRGGASKDFPIKTKPEHTPTYTLDVIEQTRYRYSGMPLKRCYLCQLEKDLSLFSNNCSKKDGKSSSCKSCDLERKRGKKRKRPTTEQNRRHKQTPGAIRYRQSEKYKESVRARRRRKYRNDPEYRAKILEKLRRYKTPEKNRAHKKVGKALKKGKLIKLPCTVCGSSSNVHAHHEDYTRKLDVTWLCASCHSKRHHEKQLMDLDTY